MVNVGGNVVPGTSLLLLLLYTLIFFPSFKLKYASVSRYASFQLSIGNSWPRHGGWELLP